MSPESTDVATRSPARARIPRRNALPAAVVDGLHEEMRRRIRDEELGALVAVVESQADQLATQSQLITLQTQLLSENSTQLAAIMKGVTCIAAGISPNTGNDVAVIAAQAAEEAPVAPMAELSPVLDLEEMENDIIVTNAFLDFIEVHSAMCKSVINHRPLLSNIRCAYSDRAEMQIMLNRGGTYGADEYMRKPILTLRIHDDYPFIEGEYMNNNERVLMTEEEVDRVVDALLGAVRNAIPDSN